MRGGNGGTGRTTRASAAVLALLVALTVVGSPAAAARRSEPSPPDAAWVGRAGPVRQGGPWSGAPGAEATGPEGVPPPELTPTLSVTDGGFGPSTWGPLVRAIAVDDEGGVLIGGEDWQSYRSVERFDDDGGRDPIFVAPDADGGVRALAIDDQGRILVAGAFTALDGVGRSRLARLSAGGALDPAFAGPAIDGTVWSLLLLDDGRLLLGGDFTTVGGQPRHGVALLTATGALDPSFGDAGIAGLTGQARGVTGLAVTADQDVYAVGDFTTVDGADEAFVTRLEPDGTRDPSFDAPTMVAPQGLRAVVLPPGGGVVVAGTVTEVSGVSRRGVARLGDDGTLDPSLGDVAANAEVSALLVADDGALVLGGRFTQVGGVNRQAVARVDAAGALDETLGQAFVHGNVVTLARQADGELLIGGDFIDVELRPQAGLARVHWQSKPVGGTPDPTFDGDGVATSRFATGGEVAYDVALQPDSAVVSAGAVAGRGGRFSVVRRDALGALDPSFGGDGGVQTNLTPGDDFARAVVLQPDGRVLAVGHAGGDTGPMALVRYLPDGRLDPSFSTDGKLTIDFGPGAEYANAVGLRPNGRIVVAGEIAGRTTQIGFAQVTRSGRLDPAFDGDGRAEVNLGPGPDWAAALTILPDGRVVAAGGSITDSAAAAVVRIEADGDPDPTFSGDGRTRLAFAGVQSLATAVAVDAQGRILVAGGQAARRGQFAVGRLTTAGVLDPSFGVDGSRLVDFTSGDDAAFDLAVTPAGRLVVAGYADGGRQLALARITRRGTVDWGVGDRGEALLDVTGGDDVAFGAAVAPDGRIVLAGRVGVGTASAAVLRVAG